ncbi:hypothetical protein K7X08_013890 [Anisodus acutangulus]|uniref:Protein SirB1 N-terminal domain-containing protein n=1 Tax=Anisodus acutangulus TaxID=402998 RepID=A0A9Q1LPC0_9SOLA|nr:hypothetical protein K7X08_013890 [Anisodus acutangulus]
MMYASWQGVCHHQPMIVGSAVKAYSSATMSSLDIFNRLHFYLFNYVFDSWTVNEKRRCRNLATASTNATKRKRLSIFPLAFSALADTGRSSRAKSYQEVQKDARKKFIQEVSFQSKDKDISLAKALLYVATEDEAFMAFNSEMDAYSIQNEMISTSLPSESLESTSMEAMLLAGKNMNDWMAEVSSREIGRNLVEVLDALNTVLFKSRGFKRPPVLVDSNCSYLHSVLSSEYCSANLLSVIYIEVCRRLNVTIVGSRVGEASDINSSSLSELEIATNRDIIGIALANLMRLHWKNASRVNHGLMLTSPLRSIDDSFSKNDSSNVHLLRPQDLRKLLMLQPHNWSLRRDHGMMLYYTREYEEAVKELSICMAFAPEEESKILEPFVEKLHLLCVESSWKKSLGHKGHLSVP